MNLDPVDMRPGPEGRLDSTELTENDLLGSMPYFKSAQEDTVPSLSCPELALAGPVDARLLLELPKLNPSTGSHGEEDSLRRCSFGL